MLNIVLVEPEIPQNCGNIARTCAATGCTLHLIRPLGFDISEKAVKRAGLDYWHLVDVRDYDNLSDFFAKNDVQRLWCLSTKAPQSTPRLSSGMATTCSLARRPRVCRKIFWKRTEKAASACLCAAKQEVST